MVIDLLILLVLGPPAPVLLDAASIRPDAILLLGSSFFLLFPFHTYLDSS